MILGVLVQDTSSIEIYYWNLGLKQTSSNLVPTPQVTRAR